MERNFKKISLIIGLFLILVLSYVLVKTYGNQNSKTSGSYINNQNNNEIIKGNIIEPEKIDVSKYYIKPVERELNSGDGYEIKDGKIYIMESIGSTLNYNLIPTTIDAETFKVFSGSYYVRDSKYIYCGGKRLDNADIGTFEINSSEMTNGFARDKNHVYYYGNILEDADPNTLERIGSLFYKDNSHVYDNYGKNIKLADAKTFIFDNAKNIYYDKNGVYIEDKFFINGADGKSFEKIGNYYYKDKNHIYYKGGIVQNANIQNFKNIKGNLGYASDNVHVFLNGKIIKDADITKCTSETECQENYPRKKYNIKENELVLSSKNDKSQIKSNNSEGWDSFNIIKKGDNIHIDYPKEGIKIYPTAISLSGSENLNIMYNNGEEKYMDDSFLRAYILETESIIILKVVGMKKEKYDLMIAGGDYYTKIFNIDTDVGQVDYFISTRQLTWMDFDDNKTGTFNMMEDNFYNNGSGTVYLDSMPVIPSSQEFIINWDEVLKNGSKSVLHKINTDNKGIYDISKYYPHFFSTKFPINNKQ